MQALLRGLAYAILSLAVTTTGLVQAADRDLDNDGRWDFNRTGADRAIDNDGRWDE